MPIKKINLNQDYLKIFAIFAMSVDHIVKIFRFNHIFSFTIGRFAFPIFAFLIMYHLSKKDLFKKYFIRLSVFGVISAVIMLPFKPTFPLNILFSLLLPAATIFIINKLKQSDMPKPLFYYFAFMVIFIFTFISELVEYSVFGYFYMLFLYIYFKTKNYYIMALSIIFSGLINIGSPPIAIISSVSMALFLFLVNMETENKRILKKWWIFYVYYPLHLFLLNIISMGLK